MSDIQVLLQCEHWGTATHEQGDRNIICVTCGTETVVRAEPVTVLRYRILFDIRDEDGKLVRAEWRTTADMQAEAEARQAVEAKIHAIEDGLLSREEAFSHSMDFGPAGPEGELDEDEQGTGPDSFDCPETAPVPPGPSPHVLRHIWERAAPEQLESD